ncbi:unnamed protein product [Echinostoma caproni]|uniref:MIF4G_like_2 domain-containing protein n=1 Tax=Echinostoma caproni TaxID=27848 RepID=A0A183B2T2_9TREM|nr:unnamed protein product [Echinostoma caproni]
MWSCSDAIRQNEADPPDARQALNERDTVSNRKSEMERNSVKSSSVLDELTMEKKEDFVAHIQSITDKKIERMGTTLRKCVNPKKLIGEFYLDLKRFVHRFSFVNLDKTLLEVLSRTKILLSNQ